MIRKTSTLGVLLLISALLPILGTFGARAAIVQTYNDKITFLSQVTILGSNVITIGPGSAPFIDLNGNAASVSAGLLTVKAQGPTPGSLLFGDSVDLSTDLSGDDLALSFSQPLRSVGLTVSVTDPNFIAVDGVLRITVVGSGDTLVSVLAAGGTAFIGLVSDTNFNNLLVSIDSFDSLVTSAAFATLTDAVYLAAAVPAPGLSVLFAPALALAFSRRSKLKNRT